MKQIISICRAKATHSCYFNFTEFYLIVSSCWNGLKYEKIEYLNYGACLFHEIKNFFDCASKALFSDVIIF